MSNPRTRSAFSWLLVVLLWPTTAAAQTSQQTMASMCRWAMAGKDVSGDRLDEVVVGGLHQVYVYSGANGDLLGGVPGTLAAWIEDRDGDRIADLLVADPKAGVQCYSGRKLTPIDSATFAVPSTARLTTLSSVPDRDGDGYSEFLCSAADFAGSQDSPAGGAVWLISGRSGAIVHSVVGAAGDAMGTTSSVGPLQPDGSVQVVLGGRSNLDSWLVQGREWTHVASHTLDSFRRGDESGLVQGIGDVDGDGWLELVVPGMKGVEAEFYSACLRVVSSIDGRVLFDLRTRTDLGTCGRNVMTDPWRAIAGMDIDRDGKSDVAVAVESIVYWPGREPLEIGPACLVVLSGADGSVIRKTRLDEISQAVWDEDGEYWGDCYSEPWGVSNLGDLNHDGFVDMLVAPKLRVMHQVFALNGENARRLMDFQLRE